MQFEANTAFINKTKSDQVKNSVDKEVEKWYAFEWFPNILIALPDLLKWWIVLRS